MSNKPEEDMFGDSHNSLGITVDDLSMFLKSRSGTLADRLIPTEPLLDWHNMLLSVTPRELLDAVNTILDHGKFSIETGGLSSYLVYKGEIGELKIETGTPSFAWNESSATEDLLISFTFHRLYLNDYATLINANKNYPSLQVLMNSNNAVLVRTYQTLKSGRTVANLMWTIIHFYHDADRFYRDLVIYS